MSRQIGVGINETCQIVRIDFLLFRSFGEKMKSSIVVYIWLLCVLENQNIVAIWKINLQITMKTFRERV